MDKQRAIEEIIELLFKHSGCASCKRKPCKDCEVRFNCAEYSVATYLVNESYGNIKQALTEFAERLKDKLRDKVSDEFGDMSDSVKYITFDIEETEDEIDWTLKEFWGE